MGDFTNRIGHDNFVWWIGVVEDRNDELNLGRCRVRIFGSHTENLQEIPTKDLPWADPVFPINSAHTFGTPLEGDWVFGFYLDGMAKQRPAMLGVFGGIPQDNPRDGVGFSANARFTNTTANSAAIPVPISVSTVPGVNKQVTSGSTETIKVTAPGMAMRVPGKPTTPANAYTANNTVVSIANSDLVHSCDFKFLIDLSSLNIGVIQDPIALIKQAIAAANNKAAAIMRAALAKLMDGFRLVIKGVTVALNLDPSGEIAKAVSTAKYYVRLINNKMKEVAEYIGSAALVVALIKELQQVIDWIKSLPAKVLAMLQNCLSTFSKAISTASSQFTLLPGQVSSSLTGAFSALQASTESTITAINTSTEAANVPSTLINIVSSPSTASANDITYYYTQNYANNEATMSESSSSNFDITQTSWA